jgi:hypothetical protein
VAEITHRLYPATPFLEGQLGLTPSASGPFDTSVSNPPKTVFLNGQVYSVELENYRHSGLPTLREGVVLSETPSDTLFNPNGGWWRYRYDWSHGAGQLRLDLGETNDRRFYTSTNIDPWDEDTLTLQPAITEILDASSGLTQPVILNQFGNYVYACNGSTIWKFDNDLAPATFVTSGIANVKAWDFDGTYIWAISDTTLYKITLAGVVATEATATGTFYSVTFTGANLLVSEDNVLKEYKPSTSSFTDIYTHYNTEFQWTTVFNIGSKIYVGGYAYNTSSLFNMTTTSGGALAISNQAASFPKDEKLYGGVGYGGSGILYSNHGIRFATVTGDGSLTYGPLIATNGDVTAVEPQGEFVWFNWQRDDELIELARLSLTTFTDTLLPAYAGDIKTSIQGTNCRSIVRFAPAGTTPSGVGAVTPYDNYRTVFTDIDGKVYASVDGSYQTSGELNTGEVYFGTVEDKSLNEINIRFSPIVAANNEKVTVDVYTDTLIGSYVAEGDGETSMTIYGAGIEFDHMHLVIKLESDGTSTPTVHQWRINASPKPPAVQQWVIPLIVAQRVIVGDGQGEYYNYDPWGELENIRSVWQNKDVIIYREGNHAYRVRIDNFAVQPRKWDDIGNWLEAIITVQLHSVGTL